MDEQPNASTEPLSMNQRTYSGLLDDVMLSFSDDFRGPEFFNRMIAKNVFFGGGIYLNDGYLLNHEEARKSLLDENSLLRSMLSLGFIRILGRGKDADALARMPETMAAQNNQSFVKLIGSSEWVGLRPVWHKIVDAAFHTNTYRPWPNYDMSFGFTKLMQQVLDSPPLNLGFTDVSPDQWKRIRDHFLGLKPQESGPRDKFQKAATAVLLGEPNGISALRETMMVANQAYHYNFGLALTEEDEHGVAVDTLAGPAFDELLQTREIQQGELDNLPVMWLPPNFPLSRGDLFTPLIRRDSDAYSAKVRYLTALDNIISSNDISTARKNLAEQNRLYQEELVRLLGPHFGRIDFQNVFDNSFQVAFGTFGASEELTPVATAAPNAALAITLQGEAEARGKSFLIERFRMKDISAEYPHDDKGIVRLGEVRTHIASLSFNEKKAKDHISDIPPAPTF